MPARAWRVTAALAIVAGALPPAVLAARAGGCQTTNETRNTWHRVAVPEAGAVVAADDTDPCSLVAAGTGQVWTSDNGGASWQQRGRLPSAATQIVRHGLPNDVVIAIPQGPGLLVSRDAGRSWAPATGLDGVQIAAVAVDPADRTSIWAAGAHGTSLAGQLAAVPTGSIFHSTDDGSSWTEDAGGLPLQPHVVARIGAPYRSVFTDDQRAGGLWRRTDQGAFTEVYKDKVHGLATSRVAGGGSQLFVAGDRGVAVSRDGGSSFAELVGGSAASGVAAEAQHFTAFMYLSGGRPYRSTDAGAHSRPVDTGLAAGCSPRDLVGDSGDPSTFQLRCADGSTWRWRSDGSDLSGVDRVDSNGNSLLSGLPRSQPMRFLGSRRLPHGRGESASIAFDGDYIYYATSHQHGRVHRIRASDGRPAPDLRLPGVKRDIIALSYDSARHILYLIDTDTVLHALQLRTGRVTRMFRGHIYTPYPPSYGLEPSGSFAFDASLDQFLAITDQATEVRWLTRTGQDVHSCSLRSTTLSATDPGTTALAAIVASGDGQLYGESEDDRTIYRLDSSCAVTAAYVHRSLSEAPDENDALTCDSVTFDVPAVWMRDATTGVAYAYAMPDGYCALSTRISVSAPPQVSTGAAGRVCAQLRRAGTGRPVQGVPIDLLVANRLVGHVRSNAAGRSCADYTPTAQEAGRIGAVSRSATTRARQPVVGAFLGTTAYRPASARASLATVDPGVPVLAPHLPVAPVAALPAALPPAAPPPIVVAPPPPPVPPAAQVQPVPQAHPGAQPGAQAMGQTMPQVGLAPQPDAEAAAATADNRDEFRAHQDPPPVPDLRVLLPAGLLMAALVARRRSASRVRGAPS